MAQWFVSRDGQPLGPFTVEQIRDRYTPAALADVLVCEEGGSAWLPAREHPAFKPIPAASPSVKATGRTMSGALTRFAVVLAAVAMLVCLVVIATGAALYIVDHEATARALQHPSLAGLRYQAYTNASAAHVTITNDTTVPAAACIVAVVHRKAGSDQARSIKACSGPIAPTSTVTIEAPYHVGAVEELCGKSGAFGVRTVDWDLCTFDVDDGS